MIDPVGQTAATNGIGTAAVPSFLTRAAFGAAESVDGLPCSDLFDPVFVDLDGVLADFDGAYRELETRYYAGEGAEFTQYGEFNTNHVMTMNSGDFDTMFNQMTSPDLRVENRSRSAFVIAHPPPPPGILRFRACRQAVRR